MKSIIILLVDVFNSLKVCNTYQLDSVHYFTLASLTCDILLKYTKQVLFFITDLIYFCLLSEELKVASDKFVVKKQAHANNNYMTNCHSIKQ